MKTKTIGAIVILVILVVAVGGYTYYKKTNGLLPEEQGLESYNESQGAVGIDYDYQGPNIENPITPRNK